MNNLFLAIMLTLLPITELRAGLPIALIYANDSGVSPILIFALILALNIMLVFILFFFLDKLHGKFLKLKFYEKFYKYFIVKFQKKALSFQKKYNEIGFLALLLLVSIPLPFTGAYSGVLLSWVSGLNRKKSIIMISLGIFIAGLIIFLTTQGIFRLIF